MEHEFLCQVTLTAPPEAEEAIACLLERLSGETAVSYRPEGAAEVSLSVYCQEGSWSQAQEQQLQQELKALRDIGLATGSNRVSVHQLARENWAESWKKHFRPLTIGKSLLIKPSWSPRRPRPKQAVLVLDPGLSFGTGHHPTTRFCLQQLVKHRQPEHIQSCLDIGTGTGILALAAAKLGYQPVRAVDFDPVAVHTAKANARLNGMDRHIQFQRSDLRTWPLRSVTHYNVICANLDYDLLVTESMRIINRLRPEGLLLLAGILTKQFNQVEAVYRHAGMYLKTSREVNEWKSGAFCFA